MRKYRVTENKLRNMIREAVKGTLKEGRIPTYEQPVFIGCSSPDDADVSVEIGYSSYASSLFYVGECGTDGYAALAAVVEYLVENGIIDHYAYSEEDLEDYAIEDFVEVEGYYLPSWQIVMHQMTGNHGERMIREAVKEGIRSSIKNGAKKFGKFVKDQKRKFDDSIYDLTRERDDEGNEIIDNPVYIPRKKVSENKRRRLNESAVGGAIRKWCYWCANYDYDFIERAWADNQNLAEHLRSKFMGYYGDVGPYGVMTKFYLNLDNHNREILEDYVMTNFNG